MPGQYEYPFRFKVNARINPYQKEKELRDTSVANKQQLHHQQLVAHESQLDENGYGAGSERSREEDITTVLGWNAR